jgi:hypothetical protein
MRKTFFKGLAGKPLFIGLLSLIAFSGESQGIAGAASDSLTAFARKVKTAYEKAAYLDFRVKYRYANASQQGQFIDSLLGTVEMDKGRSRVVIDGMESVQTGRYSINILSGDKIIYLAGAGRSPAQNPVGILDSLFTNLKGVSSRLQAKEGEEVLTLDLPAGQAYSRILLSIDPKTGLFRRVVYTVNTTGLISTEMIESPGHPAPYQSKGQIEITFTNYQQGHFDDHVFREDNFFTHVAGRYQPADRLKDYQIYLASSNL